jgi:hypothetical protein
MTFLKKWLELEIIMLNRKTNTHIVSHMRNLDLKKRGHEHKRTIWGIQWEVGEGKRVFEVHCRVYEKFIMKLT